METGQQVNFVVDASLFVNEFNANEPIPRKLTDIKVDGVKTIGEPFRLGELRGFSFEDPAGSTTLFVVNPDGLAVMSNRRDDIRINGTCARE